MWKLVRVHIIVSCEMPLRYDVQATYSVSNLFHVEKMWGIDLTYKQVKALPALPENVDVWSPLNGPVPKNTQ